MSASKTSAAIWAAVTAVLEEPEGRRPGLAISGLVHFADLALALLEPGAPPYQRPEGDASLAAEHALRHVEHVVGRIRARLKPSATVARGGTPS